MTPTHGAITAPDGWVMRWDLDRTPSRVEYVKPDGQVYSQLSGQITGPDLERYARRLRAEHAGQGELGL